MAGRMSELSKMEFIDPEIESIRQQIDNDLKILDELNNNGCQDDIPTQFPRRLKEFAKILAKIKKIESESIPKRQARVEAIRLQTDSVLKGIQQSREKIDNHKQEIESLQEKLAELQKMSQRLDSMFEFLGLQMEKKDEDGNHYRIQFSKLPIRNYDMTFSFDIRQDDNGGGNIKVLNIDPENCIDVDAILQELESCTDKNIKFLKLIVMIRRELIQKYS